jgi:ADP-ribose pyrophosphatase YjhB (NUDIX family)
MSNNRFTLHAAVYLILVKEGKILLLRRYNTGWQDGNYTLLAGHVDGNESIAETMSREALEEAGIDIKPADLNVVHTMHQIGDREYIDFYLVARQWQGNPKIMEPDKCDDMQWFKQDQLPASILPTLKQALQCYLNKETFSEFKWKSD